MRGAGGAETEPGEPPRADLVSQEGQAGQLPEWFPGAGRLHPTPNPGWLCSLLVAVLLLLVLIPDLSVL